MTDLRYGNLPNGGRLRWPPLALIRPASLPRELLRPLPELRLKSDVARALHGSQKPGELLLLGFDERDALLLQSYRSVEQVADVLLVRGIPRHHLLSELSSDVTLLRGQLAQLRRKSRIRLLELRELSVGQDPIAVA